MPVTRLVAPGPEVPMHDADLAGDAGVAVGGVGAALLVADEDVAELRVVAQDVVERQDDAARVAEEDVDALAEERLAQDVGADPRPLAGRAPRGASPSGPARRPRPRPCRRSARGCVGRPAPRSSAAVPASCRVRTGSVLAVVRSARHRLVPLVRVVGQTKDPRLPARVPSVFGGSWRLALVPPRSSVLPPGAGNEPKKPIKARKRAKKREERYVGEAVGSTGTWTRRPSVVTTTATWRRSCRSNRPNVASLARCPPAAAVRWRAV